MRRLMYIIFLLMITIGLVIPQLSQAAPKKFFPVDSNAPALPDPELNLTNENGLWHHLYKSDVKLPTDPPTNGDRGNWVDKPLTSGRNGIQITGNSELFQIPYQYIPIGRNDLLIYSPTERPYGTACLEATAAHWRTMIPNPPEPTTHHMSSFWNHCPEAGTVGWVSGSIEWMDDPTWRSKYISNDPFNGPVYSPRVSTPSTNCTRGEIWNYTTGVWDIKTPTMCGTSAFGPTSKGWVMWESFGIMDATTCNPTAIPTIRAYGEKAYNAATSTWVTINKPADGTEILIGECWENGWYGPYWTSTSMWQWAMHTPYQTRIQTIDNTVPSTITCVFQSCPNVVLKNNHSYTFKLDDWYSQVGGYASYIYLKVYMPAGGSTWTSRTFSDAFISPCTSGMFTHTNSGAEWQDIGQSVPFGTHCLTSVSMTGVAHTTLNNQTWRIEGTVRVNGIDHNFFQYYKVDP